jgi:hypothetical protein
MKTLFILASLMVVLFLSAPNQLDAQEKKPLTNADVVLMVKAKLSESTVVAAIQRSPSNFDISPPALIELKEQGVSPKIMEAMLKTGDLAVTPDQPLNLPPTNSSLSYQQFSAHEVGIFSVILIDSTGRTEMKYKDEVFRDDERLKSIINPFRSVKIKSNFDGNQAGLRITTASPTFEAGIESAANPTDQIALVKLTPRLDWREIETGTQRAFRGDSFGFRKSDIVPITIEEIKEQNRPGSFYKRYRIKIAGTLTPGEYALLAGGRYYDFGVDLTK